MDEVLHPIGSTDEFPPGSSTIVKVGRLEIGVFNLDGQLYAVQNRCPHHGGPVCQGMWGGTLLPSSPDELVYGADNKVLKCPWHRWEFDITTGHLLFRSDKDLELTRHEVEVKDGTVAVKIARRIAESAAA